MPWMAVKVKRIRPIPNEDAHTCCGANGFGSRFEYAHIVKAGAAWMPIRANMYVSTMMPVQAPPTADGPASTNWITPGIAT